ncbi:hypothetical protein [Neorhizobium vignae]|uniref:hypothetical protein n=1 Tax=Neorhizobium vignae TaxID=690585 RepID=UPI0012685EBC|nr:hypothetical protein [Neorhizobium vignae]
MNTEDQPEAVSPVRMLTALFKDLGVAQTALQRLRDAGIPDDSFGLIADARGNRPIPEQERSLWSKLEDFIFPKDDHELYSEGIRRGGYVVLVSGVSRQQFDAALDILDDEGAVNLDEHAKGFPSEEEKDTQSFLERLQDPPKLIDRDEAAAIINQGHGDEVVPIITQRLEVGPRDSDRPRVRVYVVEHAHKDTEPNR